MPPKSPASGWAVPRELPALTSGEPPVGPPRDPAWRRRSVLTGFAASIVAVLVASGIISDLIVAGPGDTSDKIGAVADVFTAATLLLAVIAGLVALLAYAVSTGTPDIRIGVNFASSPRNLPNIVVDKKVNEPWDETLIIQLKNISRYSARNPAVSVRIVRLNFDYEEVKFSPGWVLTEVDHSDDLSIKIQWDGGPNYSVHGNAIRVLPPLELPALSCSGDSDFRSLAERNWERYAPYYEFEILAEGYRRVVPISFKVLPPKLDKWTLITKVNWI
jgi:hypothetical protein